VAFFDCNSSAKHLADEACHEEQRDFSVKDPCVGAASLAIVAFCCFSGPTCSAPSINSAAPRRGRYSGARSPQATPFRDGVHQLLRRPHRSRCSPVPVLDCCEVHGLGSQTDEAGWRVQGRWCPVRGSLEDSHQFDRRGTGSTHCGSGRRACLVEIVPPFGAELTDGLCRVRQHLRIARLGAGLHFVAVLAPQHADSAAIADPMSDAANRCNAASFSHLGKEHSRAFAWRRMPPGAATVAAALRSRPVQLATRLTSKAPFMHPAMRGVHVLQALTIQKNAGLR